MKKADLTAAVQNTKASTKAALQIMYDAMNHGQQKQIVKHTEVKKLFDHFGVEYGEDAV